MKISVTPVKLYKRPKYPSRLEAKADPALLRKLPSAWSRNAKVLTAFAMLGTMTLTACHPDSQPESNTESKSDYFNVAPIFKHGNGCGSYACISMTPPKYLSESEVLAILIEESKKAGLHFTADVPDYSAKIENTYINDEYSKKPKKVAIGSGEVNFELYNAEKNIAISYISQSEARVEYIDTYEGFSMAFFEPKILAQLAGESFSKMEGNLNVGLLYSPMGESNKFEENLKAQLSDFFDWLRGEGII